MKPFQHQRRVHFHECDPAGIVYFAHVFTFCHEAYEELMRTGGLPIETLLGGATVYPLRHVEADYTGPMRMGDLVTITVTVGKIGGRSFRVDYAVRDLKGAPLATSASVHVAVDKASIRPMAIPAPVRALLEQHLAMPA